MFTVFCLRQAEEGLAAQEVFSEELHPHYLSCYSEYYTSHHALHLVHF